MKHFFDTEIAKEYGLIPAILIEYIYDQTRKNRMNLGIRYCEITSKEIEENYSYIKSDILADSINDLIYKKIINYTCYYDSDEKKYIHRFQLTDDKGYKLFEKREQKCQQLGSIKTKIIL